MDTYTYVRANNSNVSGRPAPSPKAEAPSSGARAPAGSATPPASGTDFATKPVGSTANQTTPADKPQSNQHKDTAMDGKQASGDNSLAGHSVITNPTTSQPPKGSQWQSDSAQQQPTQPDSAYDKFGFDAAGFNLEGFNRQVRRAKSSKLEYVKHAQVPMFDLATACAIIRHVRAHPSEQLSGSHQAPQLQPAGLYSIATEYQLNISQPYVCAMSTIQARVQQGWFRQVSNLLSIALTQLQRCGLRQAA